MQHDHDQVAALATSMDLTFVGPATPVDQIEPVYPTEVSSGEGEEKEDKASVGDRAPPRPMKLVIERMPAVPIQDLREAKEGPPTLELKAPLSNKGEAKQTQPALGTPRTNTARRAPHKPRDRPWHSKAPEVPPPQGTVVVNSSALLRDLLDLDSGAKGAA